MVDFTAPNAGTIQRAGPMNPIKMIINSIVGVIIGVLFILLLAPTVLWFAESQNTAKIFSFTKEVSSTSGASGYIRTTEIANANTPIVCYENKIQGNCLYYDYKLEELKYTLKDYCGNLGKNQQVIETKGQKCSRNNKGEEKCRQCYLVNESNWVNIKSETRFQPFSIGNFKVDYPNSAKIIGAENYNKQIDITHRESMRYIKDNSNLLVGGNSNGQVISHGGDKKYLLISTKDYQSTYDTLKAQDRILAWILRIITLVVLIFGYNLIFGPISLMSSFVGKIPIIGRWIDGAVGGVIFIVSLLLAIVHFIILWILIMIIKNILYIAILLAVIGLIFYLYAYFKKQN